ncbi:MAG: RidA family protein [Methylacidiphilales bacterium]|nr:RidA family protein [Candidatus Methylacidiphilales bacterium]
MESKSKIWIKSSKAPAAVGPYSQGTRYGDLIFTAGQIPLDPATGELTGKTVEEQTRLVLKNLQAVLEEGGGSFQTVLKATVFMVNLGDFAAMNKVFTEFFGDSLPARSTIQVAALPKGAQVEIEAVAFRK